VPIGDTLAQARRRAGLTVAEVSRLTRIREAVIRKIEENDYSACGGDFYARGNIRNIAKVVGTDPEPLIRDYDASHRPTDVISAVSLDELFERVTPMEAPGRSRRNWTALLGPTLVVVAALSVLVYFLVPGPGRAANQAPAGSHQQAHRVSAGSPEQPVSAASQRAVTAPPSAANPVPTASRPAASPAPPAATARALVPVSVTAFGSAGAGQGDNPQVAALAIDGKHATAWHTDWYTSAHFGNLYPGTGLLLDMGRPVTITAAQVTLGSAPGGSFQLRVGSAPSLADLPLVARAGRDGGVIHVRFTASAHGRYVLIWFTRLPPVPGGTYQASVYDVRLKGTA
jgi:cytoskeletal protein RodZ